MLYKVQNRETKQYSKGGRAWSKPEHVRSHLRHYWYPSEETRDAHGEYLYNVMSLDADKRILGWNDEVEALFRKYCELSAKDRENWYNLIQKDLDVIIIYDDEEPVRKEVIPAWLFCSPNYVGAVKLAKYAANKALQDQG